MSHKKILAAIFILALLFRIFFALAIPIFEKPDENMHFEYIEFVAENKKLPVQGNFLAEFFQPPFYYVISAPVLSFIKLFTDSIWLHVIFMRLISVFFSMLTLYLIYKIASLLFSNRNLVIGVLSFAAFLPTHLNVNSNTSNANLSQVLTTLIIYLILKSLTKTDTKKRNFLLGSVAGLALITRLSSISAVLTIPLAFIVKYFPKVKKAVKPVAVIAIIALVISSWFFVRNFMLYGDFFAYNAMKMSTPPDYMAKDLIFAARLVGWTFATFWATFGRINGIFIGSIHSLAGISVFFLFYFALLIVSLGSVFGLYIFYKKYRKNKKILSSFQKKSFIILAFHIFLLGLFFLKFNLDNFEPQGRLFFPAISGIAIFFAFGMYNLFTTFNKRAFLPAYLALFMILDAISIARVMQFFYF